MVGGLFVLFFQQISGFVGEGLRELFLVIAEGVLILQQYIDAGYGNDVASEHFGDDTVTEEPAKAAAETQQESENAAEVQHGTAEPETGEVL